MRARIIIVAACAALMAWGGPAQAHAFLKSARPPVGSTVAGPVSEVEMTMTEGVEPDFTTIAVTDAAGARVDDGKPHRVGGDPARIAVGFDKPLGPGDYRVVWHATSVDTHKTQGTFSFTVSP